jgi:MoxR-like ATPase
MLEEQIYIADAAIATTLYLSMALGKPLLIEGPAGVGKTEIAKSLAKALDTKLIRLQCYEGLDATTALYEWNYPKQLLHLKLEETSSASEAEKEAAIFSEAFLLKRPLLQAITEHERAPVLLIDEIDRSDEEFEAFLLEVLSDFQVTIPEIGTITATHRPHVVLTSNRSRDLSDALRRRCLYHWIDYPSLDKELEIVRAKVPQIGEELSRRVAQVMQATRSMSLSKIPGVAETLDWANALVALNATELSDEIMAETIGCFLKDETDIATFKAANTD